MRLSVTEVNKEILSGACLCLGAVAEYVSQGLAKRGIKGEHAQV